MLCPVTRALTEVNLQPSETVRGADGSARPREGTCCSNPKRMAGDRGANPDRPAADLHQELRRDAGAIPASAGIIGSTYVGISVSSGASRRACRPAVDQRGRSAICCPFATSIDRACDRRDFRADYSADRAISSTRMKLVVYSPTADLARERVSSCAAGPRRVLMVLGLYALRSAMYLGFADR